MKQRTGELLNNLFIRYPQLVPCRDVIMIVHGVIESCYKTGGKILICGNGGSAADSEHMAGELLKGFMLKRPLTNGERESFKKVMSPEDAEYITGHLQRGLPAISLVSQTSLYSAYVNDVAADMVFAQQVFTYGKKGDVLFAITTSGTSKNILRALKTAKAIGLTSVLLMGQRNKEIAAPLADLAICVGESETYKIQELHLPIYHALCAAIEAEFFDT